MARRRHRRVTVPGTSGQPEEQEAEVYDPLAADQDETREPEAEQDAYADWLKSQRPPHW
ncbi:hypothetical protein [Nesterenkonia sp.]|uniref:hypothetical protein n=1 Tax=Nesterenkonia sp. TaxID=704201 RepID=UPI002628AFC8|nr:hypothetical protein [Nesterenkonia sp.]